MLTRRQFGLGIARGEDQLGANLFGDFQGTRLPMPGSNTENSSPPLARAGSVGPLGAACDAPPCGGEHGTGPMPVGVVEGLVETIDVDHQKRDRTPSHAKPRRHSPSKGIVEPAPVGEAGRCIECPRGEQAAFGSGSPLQRCQQVEHSATIEKPPERGYHDAGQPELLPPIHARCRRARGPRR